MGFHAIFLQPGHDLGQNDPKPDRNRNFDLCATNHRSGTAGRGPRTFLGLPGAMLMVSDGFCSSEKSKHDSPTCQTPHVAHPTNY